MVLSSILLFLVFGCLTGVTTVLFGFGGGFVIVPVVYALSTLNPDAPGDAMLTAVATSTAVMIVNSLMATYAHWRSGRLRREYLWPLGAFIALGALAGAFAATRVDDRLLHALFIAYLAVTIVDGLVRRGFVTTRSPGNHAPLGRWTTSAGGVGIGAVASFLGVGGSVMTVPLLRRKGLAMANAAAMANPLSVPVSIVGAAVYAFSVPTPAAALASGQLGYIDLLAGACLLAGSLPTIMVVRRLVGKLPDRVHALAFISLLALVLVAMLVL